MPAGLTLYLWCKGADPGLPGLSCPLRALTGLPCPTCFLTRATAAALHGDWSVSWQAHAFGIPAAGLLLLWSVWSLRQRRLLPARIPARPVAVTVVALWLYWLVRLLAWRGWHGSVFPSA